MQLFFGCTCIARYHNLHQNLKTCLQAPQNKCIRFCLKLEDRKNITFKEFEKINWLLNHERANQCTLSCIYKFHAKKAPD